MPFDKQLRLLTDCLSSSNDYLAFISQINQFRDEKISIPNADEVIEPF